ncbi:MAG: UDP-N-acetylglucosamine 1-carboxyvinyltransferase [Dehalococcoidia bacterium]|nr:UDP-N-acetylglucosamine 1-carboxyvinyltransferase [Dehalococcoidia bacterium]
MAYRPAEGAPVGGSLPEALTTQYRRFVIEGGFPLSGSMRISGSKNATLPLMAAGLLTSEPCVLYGVPDIDDVRIMAEVLRSLGARLEWQAPGQILIQADQIANLEAPTELVSRMRGSFLVLGPLLARFGSGSSCPPGGDVIGQRPIDVHLAGFAALGARITRDGEVYTATSPLLRGATVFMDYPSHIGTENLLMAACLAKGSTVLINASQEPEVVDLANMLLKMGARIQGAGTSVIQIEGVDHLGGAEHTMVPDRIEAGTFAIAAAVAGGAVHLTNVCPEHLNSLVWKLRETGVTVRSDGDSLFVARDGPLTAVNVQALPYPGFATDLQAAFGVLLTQATGMSIIHERVYDNRLLYVQELRKMGASVQVSGQTAVIKGPCKLKGATVRALDIRSGAALMLAGLAAEGTSYIEDIQHLERGYEAIDQKLQALGAHVSRV